MGPYTEEGVKSLYKNNTILDEDLISSDRENWYSVLDVILGEDGLSCNQRLEKQKIESDAFINQLWHVLFWFLFILGSVIAITSV